VRGFGEVIVSGSGELTFYAPGMREQIFRKAGQMPTQVVDLHAAFELLQFLEKCLRRGCLSALLAGL
jgi:hypothetical protein